MTAEIYTEKQRNLKYPKEDEETLAKIEDMFGKKNREEAREAYKVTIRILKKEYHNKQLKIDNEFKLALFKEYSVENNPKREKAFSMAWEMGHAEGYSNIESYFSELVELIK